MGLQNTTNNDNQRSISSSDEDEAGHQGGVNLQVIRQPIGPPESLKIQKLIGFSKFVRDHISPTHKRVTAGGRIVPVGPITPPVTFTKPFLEDFIKVTDRVFQTERYRNAQVSEDDRQAADNLKWDQSSNVTALEENGSYVMQFAVDGNPYGPLKVSIPDNAARPLTTLIDGAEIIDARPDGPSIVLHHNMLWTGTQIGASEARYDSLYYQEGLETFGNGPGFGVLDMVGDTPAGNASAIAAGGDTEPIDGQPTSDGVVTLPAGAQIQQVSPDGTHIFSYRGKVHTARLSGGETVYGEVLQLMPPMHQTQAMRPMQVTTASGFGTHQYPYDPAAGFGPETKESLSIQLERTTAALKELDKRWARFGDERDHHQRDDYSQKRRVLVNTVGKLRHGIKTCQLTGPTMLVSGTGEGPSNSGHLNRMTKAQPKKLSPDAQPFVPGSYGFAGPSVAGPSVAGPSFAGPSSAGPSSAGPSAAGPSSTIVLLEAPLRHFHQDSTDTWNSEMEAEIVPSIESVIMSSSKGKEKAVEYDHKEVKALEPKSVFASDAMYVPLQIPKRH